MIIFREISPLRKYLSRWKTTGKIGFVPTMGALHQGHLELISRSRKENAGTLCSIFVNPTQFNDPQDFQKYPITIETDIQKLESLGCDVVFLPSVTEIYPEGLIQEKLYDLGRLDLILEGKFRPGHFQGVCRVVDRLLSIVEPNRLYLGQKDYQQCMVIKKMMDLTGKTSELIICETIREADGLAMSSRNVRLTAEQREIAPQIYKTLKQAQMNLGKGSPGSIETQALEQLKTAGMKPEYFEIVDAKTLETVEDWNGKDQLIAVVATYLGDVRLIDNLIL